jgi:hypothetical protein
LRNYVGSSHQLDHLNKYLLPQWNQEAEAEYIKAVNEFELGNASSLTMLEDFIENYANEPLAVAARAKVGDYYYSDGSTSSVLNADRTCVGIVYALTNANGEIDQNLTESSSGCVVAIKDLNNSTLYRWSAKVENTSIADYTTVDGTKNTAFLPFYKGQAGVYYSTENKLEISDASNIALWPKQGCISDFAGDDHAQYFTSSTYYAAGYNSRNGGLASLNWYLPSMGELMMVYLQEKNGVISHAKQSPYINLSEQSYWS